MLYVAAWFCWFGAASLYASCVMVLRPRLRTLGATVLVTSALLVFYLPVRMYLRGPYIEEGFPDLSPCFEFLWVVVIFGPLHLVCLLMLVAAHLRERGRDGRKAVPTDS